MIFSMTSGVAGIGMIGVGLAFGASMIFSLAKRVRHRLERHRDLFLCRVVEQ